MLLSPVYDHDNEFRLLRDEEVTVGRKDCQILLSNDSSISRIHAKLLVQQDGAVFVTDLSKYGTSINRNQITTNQRFRLNERDVIKFGNQSSKSSFRLVSESLVFCCSGVSKGKTEIKKLVDKLGAKLVESWDNSCTHLIMNSIVVTVKVVNALSNLRPIITPKWVESAVEAIRNGKPFPPCSDFLPDVTDPNCDKDKITFLPNEARSFLLSGKVFYFLTEKQYQRLRECVENVGGICKLATTPGGVDELGELVGDNAVVLTVDSKTLSSLDASRKRWVQQALSFLKSKGRRAIVDSEVGFALMHVSTAKHCNPASPQKNIEPLPPPSLSQRGDVLSQQSSLLPAAGDRTVVGSMGNITVFASETEFGSEETSSSFSVWTPPPRQSNLLVATKVEPEAISVGPSVPTPPAGDADMPDHRHPPTSNNSTPLHYKPLTPAHHSVMRGNGDDDDEDSKMVSPLPPARAIDGPSCSPGSTLTTPTAVPVATAASTSDSVIIPGTFTQKSQESKDVKTLSTFFNAKKKRKHPESDDVIDLSIDPFDVVDLTQDKSSTSSSKRSAAATDSTANTSVSIFEVLSAQKKRRREVKAQTMAAVSKETGVSTLPSSSVSPAIVVAKELLSKVTTPVAPIGVSANGRDEDVSEPRMDFLSPRANEGVVRHSTHSTEQMDCSSLRPVLSRFRRFASRSNINNNRFMSARNRPTAELDGSGDAAVDAHRPSEDDVPVAPPVPCEVMSLVHCSVLAPALIADALSDSSTVNFKKFKKAKYKGMGTLPTILGGSDLITFAEESSTLSQAWLDRREYEEETVLEEDPDPFRLPSRR